jgi:hypothetical protein
VDPNAKRILADPKGLQDDARNGTQRMFWESDSAPVMARISGQFIPGKTQDRYRLMRIKITCCASDSTPVDATVVGKIEPDWKYGDWLEVDGPVAFVEAKSEKATQEYYPVVYQVDFRKTDAKPYIQ